MRTRLHIILGLAAGLLAAGCGTAPTSPATGTVEAASTPSPSLRQVQIRYTPDALLVTGAVDRWRSQPFGPDQAGGWCFQLFLNTDEAPSGYGRGYDYLVRGIEVTRDHSVHVRRTEGGTGPGGWGESVGLVNLSTEEDLVSFAVPLAMLNDDGRASFVLEVYQTRTKDDGHLWHEFVVGYEGASISVDRPASRITLRHESLTADASRID